MPARTFSLLIAVFAGAVAAHAAVPAPPLPHLTGALPGGSWVIADFNGDGQPDILTSTLDRRGTSGYRHQMDLRIGSRGDVRSAFQVVGASRGLNLFARDVDGDHDLDVVITSFFSDAPVGVWINDGAGIFTEGRCSAYPAAIWRSLRIALRAVPPPVIDACALQEERVPADSPRAGAGSAAFPTGRQIARGANAFHPYRPAAPLGSRAPPILA